MHLEDWSAEGYDIGGSGTGNRAAVQAAAGGGHLDVVKPLLDYGANVNEGPASTDGRTALGAAAQGGFCDVVGLLLDREADANAAATSDGLTAVRMAAAYGP